MDFCKNCGSEIKGTKFCTKCGTKVEEAPAPPAMEFPADIGSMSFGMPEKKKSKGGLIAIIISAVVVVALVATYFLWGDQILGMFGGGKGGKSSPESVAEAFMGAFKKCDAEGIVDLMPKEVVKKSVEEEFDGDKEEMIKDIQDALDKAKDSIEDQGVKMSKIKYEIVDVEDVDEDDIEELNEALKDQDVDLTIKDAKTVEIELSYPSEDEDEDETVPLKIGVIKIGNSWYLLSPEF